jgi:channel protein (hemolysin III family)
VVGACAFSATAILLYFASAMYHVLPAGRAKRVFNTLDHSAIYLFIAGSYTPFAHLACFEGAGVGRSSAWCGAAPRSASC